MKKALLLSCSTGGGHDSSAKAIQEYFRLQGIDCGMEDALRFVSKEVASLVSKGHSFIYRHVPGLFSRGYRDYEKHPGIFDEGSVLYRALTKGCRKLRSYLEEGGYDTVICTHLFAAIMMTHIRKQEPLGLQTAFVATDHTYFPGTEGCDMDWYFAADADTADDYAACGVPRDRIQVSGIPVKRSFFACRNREAAKMALGIPPENQHLLVMCGSMGCGPIPEILESMAAELPDGVDVSVICGTNEHLYRELSRDFGTHPRIHIIGGFVERISAYYEAADLFLTKPGGISTTEAAAARLPMIFIDAVAGCEQYNMDFFVSMGGAVTAKTPKELADKSLQLLRSPATIEAMRKKLEDYDQPDGAALIYETLRKEAEICQDSISSTIENSGLRT